MLVRKVIKAKIIGSFRNSLQISGALDYLAKFYGFAGGYIWGTMSALFVKKRYREYVRLRNGYEKRFGRIVQNLYFFWEKSKQLANKEPP